MGVSRDIKLRTWHCNQKEQGNLHWLGNGLYIRAKAVPTWGVLVWLITFLTLNLPAFLFSTSLTFTIDAATLFAVLCVNRILCSSITACSYPYLSVPVYPGLLDTASTICLFPDAKKGDLSAVPPVILATKAHPHRPHSPRIASSHKGNQFIQTLLRSKLRTLP